MEPRPQLAMEPEKQPQKMERTPKIIGAEKLKDVTWNFETFFLIFLFFFSPEAVILINLELSNERFGKPKLDTSFKIMVGSFYDCIIPEDIEPLWGPIPLQKLPRGVDNKCRAVTHG